MTGYAAAVAKHGSQSAAARALGMSRSTFRRRLANERGSNGRPAVPMPFVPKREREPIEDVIALRCREYRRAEKFRAGVSWFPVAMPDALPVGLHWFGDPHLDDPGCNWPLLLRQIEACANAPGVYGVNIGDSVNAWVGSLARLYAEQDTSAETGLRLADWFLNDCGVAWLAWLMGNHDEWNQTAPLLRSFNTSGVPMLDWHASFEMQFPNGRTCRVRAAHDFPGHSMWNKTHGPSRAAQMTYGDADIYVCGHKHVGGLQSFEHGGRVPDVLRVRGYKFDDKYARRLGHPETESMSGMLTIVDPCAATAAGLVQTYKDLDQGLIALAALRAHRAKTGAKRKRVAA